MAAPATAAYADDAMLPAEISTSRPARLVSTTVDTSSRPVITVRTATSRTDARRFVAERRKAPRSVAVEVDAPARIAEVPTGSDSYRVNQRDFAKLDVASAWPYSTPHREPGSRSRPTSAGSSSPSSRTLASGGRARAERSLGPMRGCS